MGQMLHVTVRATLADENWYLLDCTECGPLGAYGKHETDDIALGHLQGHGVDTSGFYLGPR